MFEFLKFKWQAKVAIATMRKDVELKRVAHDAAHNIAITRIDKTVFGQPHRNYKEIYDSEYDRLLVKLSAT